MVQRRKAKNCKTCSSVNGYRGGGDTNVPPHLSDVTWVLLGMKTFCGQKGVEETTGGGIEQREQIRRRQRGDLNLARTFQSAATACLLCAMLFGVDLQPVHAGRSPTLPPPIFSSYPVTGGATSDEPEVNAAFRILEGTEERHAIQPKEGLQSASTMRRKPRLAAGRNKGVSEGGLALPLDGGGLSGLDLETLRLFGVSSNYGDVDGEEEEVKEIDVGKDLEPLREYRDEDSDQKRTAQASADMRGNDSDAETFFSDGRRKWVSDESVLPSGRTKHARGNVEMETEDAADLDEGVADEPWWRDPFSQFDSDAVEPLWNMEENDGTDSGTNLDLTRGAAAQDVLPDRDRLDEDQEDDAETKTIGHAEVYDGSLNGQGATRLDRVAKNDGGDGIVADVAPLDRADKSVHVDVKSKSSGEQERRHRAVESGDGLGGRTDIGASASSSGTRRAKLQESGSADEETTTPLAFPLPVPALVPVLHRLVASALSRHPTTVKIVATTVAAQFLWNLVVRGGDKVGQEVHRKSSLFRDEGENEEEASEGFQQKENWRTRVTRGQQQRRNGGGGRRGGSRRSTDVSDDDNELDEEELMALDRLGFRRSQVEGGEAQGMGRARMETRRGGSTAMATTVVSARRRTQNGDDEVEQEERSIAANEFSQGGSPNRPSSLGGASASKPNRVCKWRPKLLHLLSLSPSLTSTNVAQCSRRPSRRELEEELTTCRSRSHAAEERVKTLSSSVEETSRTLKALRQQLDHTKENNIHLRDQLRHVQEEARVELQKERQKSSEELEMEREEMRTVLDRERRLMREQVRRMTEEMRRQLRAELRAVTDAARGQDEDDMDEFNVQDRQYEDE